MALARLASGLLVEPVLIGWALSTEQERLKANVQEQMVESERQGEVGAGPQISKADIQKRGLPYVDKEGPLQKSARRRFAQAPRQYAGSKAVCW